MSHDMIQLLGTCASVLFTLVGGCHLWIANQIRIQVAELRLEMEMRRNEDREDLKLWVEERFQPLREPWHQ